jgi:hypothetical protein
MTRVLLAKEWQGMRPFAWLLGALAAIDVLMVLTADLYRLHREYTLYATNPWVDLAGALLLLAFALGSGLLAREIEEHTLAFLDGLPLRRRDVFLAKLAVAGACLLGYALIDPALAWLLHLLLRHSVDEPVGAATLAALVLRYALVAAAGLGLGLLFGFVRHLSWALLAVTGAGFVVMRSVWPRAAAAVDPTALLADGWATHGLDGSAVAGVAALALGCIALAGLLFVHAGGPAMLRLTRLVERRAFGIAVYAVGAVVVVAAAVLAAGDAGDPAAEASAQDDEPVARGARKVVTPHYTFDVPAGVVIGDRALRAADAAFATASAALGAGDPADAPRIDVDLGGSIGHTLGLAGHGRIRIEVDDGWENTLVHETVHVLLAWAAGPQRAADLDAMSLLNEGTAHWAEPARRAGAHADDDFAVAALFRRGLLGQDVLLDARALDRELDVSMKYALGARLAEALAARYGQDAPLRVVRALARPGFPRGLTGDALYRAAFQPAGFDLDLVLNDFALALRRLSEQYAPVIDAMPRPRGLLMREGNRAGIAVQLDAREQAGDDLKFVVRFRPREDSPIDEQVIVRRLERRGGREIAWLPLAKVANDQVCYQIGIGVDGGPFAVEPWSCLPLRVAMAAPPRRRER